MSAQIECDTSKFFLLGVILAVGVLAMAGLILLHFRRRKPSPASPAASPGGRYRACMLKRYRAGPQQQPIQIVDGDTAPWIKLSFIENQVE